MGPSVAIQQTQAKPGEGCRQDPSDAPKEGRIELARQLEAAGASTVITNPSFGKNGSATIVHEEVTRETAVDP
jgi:hypothetical protein